MAAPAYTPNTWEVEIGGSEVHGHPWLHNKSKAILDHLRPGFKKKKTNKQKEENQGQKPGSPTGVEAEKGTREDTAEPEPHKDKLEDGSNQHSRGSSAVLRALELKVSRNQCPLARDGTPRSQHEWRPGDRQVRGEIRHRCAQGE